MSFVSPQLLGMSASFLPHPPQLARQDDILPHYPLDKATKECMLKALRVKITVRKSHIWETDFIPSVKSQVQVQLLAFKNLCQEANLILKTAEKV